MYNLFAVRWNTSPVEHQSVDFFFSIFVLERFSWNTSQLGIFFYQETLSRVFLQIFVETYPVVCMPRKHIRKVAMGKGVRLRKYI